MSDSENQTDVQTLLGYFDKLLNTFRQLMYVGGVVVTAIFAVFGSLVCNSKEQAVEAATAKVTALEENIEQVKEELEYFKDGAKDDLLRVREDASSAVEYYKRDAEREIRDVKFTATRQVTEEVDKFINSPGIQNEIDRRVKEEIEEYYFDHLGTIGKIEDAAARMRADNFYGMLQLRKFSEEAETEVLRKYAAERLYELCHDVMNWWGTFDYETPFSTNPIPEAIKKDRQDMAAGNGILNRLENYLRLEPVKLGNIETKPTVGVYPIVELIRMANQFYGKNYSICEYEKVIEFLRNYKE